ncbi:tyrosine-type recombinase/integrase [Rosistilla oblonga]|uniref:tyrosine-type recombinase/integrase n=1 Tax=Rosistilla oblonga TaxID=2527990 RepID=UPI003A96A426
MSYLTALNEVAQVASLFNESANNQKPAWRLQFYFPSSKRRAIYLGRTSRRAAEAAKRHVDDLVRAKKANVQPDASTTAWLGGIDSDLHSKLAAVGLCNERRYQGASGTELGAFIDKFIADRDGTEWKPNTARNYRNSREWIVGFFGAKRQLADITKADVKRWRRWMETEQPDRKTKKLSESTAAKHHKRAREMLTEAVNDKLIQENPFRAKISIPVDEDKQFYVSREAAAAIIAANDCLEWKAIVALTRYCGLRCPSEVLNLQWDHIDWEEGRFWVIPENKTETGRHVPLFPRVRTVLDNLRAQAGAGIHVITRYRDSEQNLRTQLHRVIRRAGIEPWPKAFMNMRASCRTDLERNYLHHTVNKWLGHGSAIAERHYLMNTHEEWSRAVETDDFEPASSGGVNFVVIGANPESSSDTESAKTPATTNGDDCGQPGKYPRRDSNP